MDLARTYQTEGAAKFVSALLKQSHGPLTYDLEDSYQASGDAAGAVKLLDEKLKNAESNLERMRMAADNQVQATM
jgi:hypothetical protein